MLSTDSIFFAYADQPVIKGITLDFRAGRFYSIIGPNGCGKTTLLDLLVRHHVPARGVIRLHGRPLADYKRKALARQIAVVSQDYAINFPFSVFDIVMMGRHPHIPRFSRPAASDLDMVYSTMEMTGILPFMDRKITDLSGGERQRCVLARALCQDTAILFLDEAFSNLDISHTYSLLEIIRDLVHTQNKTVISVFHDINLAAAWSDELIFMNSGTVAISGETREIFSEDVIHRIFNVTAKVDYNPYTGALQASFKGANGHA